MTTTKEETSTMTDTTTGTIYDAGLPGHTIQDHADRIRTDPGRVWWQSAEELIALYTWASGRDDLVVRDRCRNEIARRVEFGDPDATPCCDCGVLLPLDAAGVYAIDCGAVCASCAAVRYGTEAAKYKIA
jgi:hypothetical protein